SAKTPRAVSRSTRTRRSALDRTDATGGGAGAAGGRLARSIRRLYSVSDSVTARDGSFGRGGGCPIAIYGAGAKSAANKREVLRIMISSSLSGRSARLTARVLLQSVRTPGTATGRRLGRLPERAVRRRRGCRPTRCDNDRRVLVDRSTSSSLE